MYVQYCFTKIVYKKKYSYLISFVSLYLIQMSNLTNLKFVALDILGKNFLLWILDTKIHLEAMNLDEIYVNVINPENIIMDGNKVSQKDR